MLFMRKPLFTWGHTNKFTEYDSQSGLQNESYYSLALCDVRCGYKTPLSAKHIISLIQYVAWAIIHGGNISRSDTLTGYLRKTSYPVMSCAAKQSTADSMEHCCFQCLVSVRQTWRTVERRNQALAIWENHLWQV